LKNRITKVVSVLWIINEVIQGTQICKSVVLIHFFVIHISSFFGAIIFSLFIDHLDLNKKLLIVPLAIELLQSFDSCNCIDFWDLSFSFLGLYTSLFIAKK
jgi:hypothetical protein